MWGVDDGWGSKFVRRGELLLLGGQTTRDCSGPYYGGKLGGGEWVDGRTPYSSPVGIIVADGHGTHFSVVSSVLILEQMIPKCTIERSTRHRSHSGKDKFVDLASCRAIAIISRKKPPLVIKGEWYGLSCTRNRLSTNQPPSSGDLSVNARYCDRKE